MEQNLITERSKAPFPHRSYTSLPKITTTSDSKDVSLSRRHNPLHRDKHNGHHHHHHHRHRQAKDVLQLAVQSHSHSSFGDNAKQNGRSNAHSPAQSVNGETDSHTTAVKQEVTERIDLQRLIRPIHVTQERQRAAVREEELRVTLHTLSEKSLDITRRLDDTYYSILERLTALGSTISGLHELSSLTQELNSNFQKDAKAFETEVQAQIDSFEGFHGLVERVEGIVSRIQSIKDKCGSLSKRLEQASQRVETREKYEIRRQTQSDQRARVVKWATACAALAILLLAMLYFFYLVEHSQYQPRLPAPSIGTIELDNLAMPADAREILMNAQESLHARNSSTSKVEHAPVTTGDVRLRVLDEL